MKLWILIADESRARLFAAEGGPGSIQELRGLVHPRGRMREQDITEDRPGRVRTTASGRGVAALPSHTVPAHVESAHFAGELTHLLQQARANGEFDFLAIVAPPRFLGVLRNGLDEQVRQRLVATIDKGLTRIEAREIPTQLKEIFEAATRSELAAEVRR